MLNTSSAVADVQQAALMEEVQDARAGSLITSTSKAIVKYSR